MVRGRDRIVDFVESSLSLVSGQLPGRKYIRGRMQRIREALLSGNTSTMEESSIADGPSLLITKRIVAAATDASATHHCMMTMNITYRIPMRSKVYRDGIQRRVALLDVSRPY